MTEYRGRVTKQPPINVTSWDQTEPEYLSGGWLAQVYTNDFPTHVVASEIVGTHAAAMQACHRLLTWITRYR